MPLNINLQQILLHALNFVILFGAMYFLLYKPVKSFMDSRKAHYEKMDEDAKAVLAEAEIIHNFMLYCFCHKSSDPRFYQRSSFIHV